MVEFVEKKWNLEMKIRYALLTASLLSLAASAAFAFLALSSQLLAPYIRYSQLALGFYGACVGFFASALYLRHRYYRG